MASDIKLSLHEDGTCGRFCPRPTSHASTCHTVTLVSDKENCWKQSEAWACTLALVLVSFCSNTFLRVLCRTAGHGSVVCVCFGSFASALLRSGLWLLVVYVLAGTRSLGAFASRVGLLKRPSLAGWFSAWAGAGIGLLELFFISRAWNDKTTAPPKWLTLVGAPWRCTFCPQ
jgi:hypothetical protein